MLQSESSLKNRLQKNNFLNTVFYCTIKYSTVFYCTIFYCFGQVNLVFNSSFESYTTCPTAGSQLTYASPWYAPTNDNADYFNSCSVSYTVPQNFGSYYLYANTGNAYSAIWAYNVPGNDYREYIQTQLSSPMVNGTCYYVEFYYVLANICQYPIKKLAANLSDTAIYTTGTGLVLNIPPHIYSFSGKYESDTINWSKISGIYISTGGEQFLTIGNFYGDTNTSTMTNPAGTYPGAYYFIDDVSVIALDSSKGSSFSYWEYIDTSVYAGDSVFIGQELTGLNCTWYDTLGNVLADSVPGIYVSPTTTTNYIVVENLCGTIRTDTITVTINYVGIEEQQPIQKIVVYPNPASGAITIGGFEKNVNFANIRLTDMQGHEIFNGAVVVKNGMAQLDIDVSNGTYLLYIRLPGNERTVKRIVIQE